jgi:hypothetical protein
LDDSLPPWLLPEQYRTGLLGTKFGEGLHSLRRVVVLIGPFFADSDGSFMAIFG